jgi:hypothetical protein
VATYRFTARIEVSGEIEVNDEVMDTEHEPSPDGLANDLDTSLTVEFAENMAGEIAGYPVRFTLDNGGSFELQDVQVEEAAR